MLLEIIQKIVQNSVGAIYLKCNLHVTPTEFYQINKLICYQHVTSTRFNNKF